MAAENKKQMDPKDFNDIKKIALNFKGYKNLILFKLKYIY